jgi:predicted deacylase
MRVKKNPTVLFAVALLSINGTASLSQETLRVGGVTAHPGEEKSGFIGVPAGTDGPEVQIPISIINGITEGPVLALTAGIHGYEYPPIIALQRLRKQLEPSQLSGAVILVHVVNVPSFLKRTTYYNPYDWKNQNRAFPGKINGSMTERIAYQISKEVIDQCDVLIDNHCGDSNEDLTTYLYCTEIGEPRTDERTRALAENYGFKMIIHQKVKATEPGASWCANSALFKGKPALTVECGKLGRTDEEYVDSIINGSCNILKLLQMIPGKPERIFDPVWVEKTTYVRSEHEGLFYPLVRGGQHVQRGEMVGYLTDFFGNIIQKAFAPHEGIVMYIISTPPMSKGEPMVKIGGF